MLATLAILACCRVDNARNRAHAAAHGTSHLPFEPQPKGAQIGVGQPCAGDIWIDPAQAERLAGLCAAEMPCVLACMLCAALIANTENSGVPLLHTFVPSFL